MGYLVGDGHPTGPLEGLQAHIDSPLKGGVLFLKASTNCVLGDLRGHFIIDHSHYYYYYITIFIKPPPTEEWGAK